MTGPDKRNGRVETALLGGGAGAVMGAADWASLPLGVLALWAAAAFSVNGRQVADAARITRKHVKVLFVTGYVENAATGNGHLGPGMEVLTGPSVMSVLGKHVREIIALS